MAIKHRKFLLFVLLVVIGEFFLSNRISFLLGHREICDLNLVTASGRYFSIDGHHLTFHKPWATVDIDIPENIESDYISIVFVGEESSLVSGHVWFSDDSRTDRYYDANTFLINPASDKKTVVPVESLGNLRKLRLTFSGQKSGDTLQAIRINDVGIAYNFIRVLMILLLGGVLYSGFIFGPLNEGPFEVRNRRHAAAFLVVVLINLGLAWCILYSLSGIHPKDTSYPLRSSIGKYDMNVRTFDALKKGELYLETDISDINVNLLSNLNNPYDPGEREGIKYHSDYSFYQNQYYRYPGIAPVLAYYFPYYILHHALPNINRAAFFFECWFILFICGSIILALEITKARLKVWTVMLMELLLPAASLSFVWESCADVNYLISSSAYTFMAMFLFFTLGAYLFKDKMWAFLFLFLAGLGVVFLLASKPLAAIPIVLMMLPMYISGLGDGSIITEKKVMMASFLAVPIIAGVVGLMIYNFQRFGTVLESGGKYLLTVGDLSYNHIDFSAASLKSYIVNDWFRLLDFSNKFPFITFDDRDVLDGVGKIIYKEKAFFGVLAIPINWFLFLLPQYNKERPAYRFMTRVGFLGGLVVLFLDYHFWGANSRYLGDVLLVFIIISSLIVLGIFEMESSSEVVVLTKRITVAILIATLIISYLLIINNEKNNIRNAAPDIYMFIRSLFQIT